MAQNLNFIRFLGATKKPNGVIFTVDFDSDVHFIVGPIEMLNFAKVLCQKISKIQENAKKTHFFTENPPTNSYLNEVNFFYNLTQLKPQNNQLYDSKKQNNFSLPLHPYRVLLTQNTFLLALQWVAPRGGFCIIWAFAFSLEVSWWFLNPV